MTDPASPATDGAKRYLTGTHRIIDPDATLASVLPLARHMGITRIAVLTGLDVLGIPVAAAVRPNSRSIAVHQGKGVTLSAAKASALMEAVETRHAETMALPLRLASSAEFAPDAADPMLLPRCAGREAGDERLLWVEAQDLMSGSRLWVPHELVSADFTCPMPAGAGLFQATTNGLRRATIGWRRCFTAFTKQSSATRSRCGALHRMLCRIGRRSTSTASMHLSACHCCMPFAAPAWRCASGT